MSSIGGYFGLELGSGYEYHKDAIRLNTGRNALEYILIAKKYKKIYLPYFTCDALLEPIGRTGLKIAFYYIDDKFEPDFNYGLLTEEDVFLYTNYFGLKDFFIEGLCKKNINIIIDNAQAFFSKPLKGIDTFYSARKFFGVPDGAYLYTSSVLDITFETDISWGRSEHLLIRLDESAEAGFHKFVENDRSLCNNCIKGMSNLTFRIMDSIDYMKVSTIRRENYLYLFDNLQHQNELNFPLLPDNIPLAFPFLTTFGDLRDVLIKNKIYTPQYWDSVFKQVPDTSIEYNYAKNIVYLPVDQRLKKEDLDFIIKIIKNEYKR